MFQSIQNMRVTSITVTTITIVFIALVWAYGVLMYSSNLFLSGLGLCTLVGVLLLTCLVNPIMKVLITHEYRHSVVPKLESALKACGLDQVEIDQGFNASSKEGISSRERKAFECAIQAAKSVIDQEADLRVMVWNREFDITDDSELAQLCRKAGRLTLQLLY